MKTTTFKTAWAIAGACSLIVLAVQARTTPATAEGSNDIQPEGATASDSQVIMNGNRPGLAGNDVAFRDDVLGGYHSPGARASF